MALPGGRLDLVFVPADPDATGPDGFSPPDGSWRVERHARAALYTRQQGGFSAKCPLDGRIVTAPFVRAHAAWRDGHGPRAVDCPCGARHDLAALRFVAPGGSGHVAAAYARFAVIHLDAPSATPELATTESFSASFGPFVVIARRPSG